MPGMENDKSMAEKAKETLGMGGGHQGGGGMQNTKDNMGADRSTMQQAQDAVGVGRSTAQQGKDGVGHDTSMAQKAKDAMP